MANVIYWLLSTGSVTTFAGFSAGYANGMGTAAMFSAPSGVRVASNGRVYVADNMNNRVRSITSSGV